MLDKDNKETITECCKSKLRYWTQQMRTQASAIVLGLTLSIDKGNLKQNLSHIKVAVNLKVRIKNCTKLRMVKQWH